MKNYSIPLTADEQPIDMGSLVISKKNANIYEFKGLNVDRNKLPTYKAIGTGSSAFLIDTGTVLIYEATTKIWYEV